MFPGRQSSGGGGDSSGGPMGEAVDAALDEGPHCNEAFGESSMSPIFWR